ncbi:MAG: ATP-binding cassette domain-containing protein [Ruminococcus sp.]|nr:ATP-binding cassette domain-containing protein [Ruminococcus sp.]
MTLELKNVSKHYKKKSALNGFTYSFSSGIYALLGPNGAGKSTLMNIIAGVIDADAGSEIILGDKSIGILGDEYRSHIGFMPQKSALMDSFSALRFMKYISGLKGLKNTDSEIAELLRKVELFDNRNEKCGGFSGGMKQRLMLAQAMLGSPDILILDEPTAGLDPRQRVIFRNMIREYSESKTVILSTHIVSDIEAQADCIIIMQSDKIAASGSNSALLTQYGCSELEELYMKLFGEKDDI